MTLLAAGAEPRTQLRYRLRPAQQETMDLTMLNGMNMTIGEMAVPVELPSLTISVRVDVLDLASSGDITYAIAFTKLAVGAGGDPVIAATMRQAIDSLTTLKGTGVVSNRGVARSVKIDSSGIPDPTMKQAFDRMDETLQNMSMPMPEEAVGVGARWEVRTAVQSSGASIFQKAEYEIVSIAGPAVTLKAKVEQTAPPQSLNVPNMPPGADAALTKMTGTGSGTVSLRLDAITPTSSMESTSSMSMDITENGQKQSMTTQLKLKVTVAPAK